MITDQEIQRINELARKSKSEGLSDEEKAEQAVLRRKYVNSVVGNLRGQLDNTTIVRPDGTKHPVKPKK